ncbi:MAG: DUF4892 domain-containing protein [candidate division WOR-3 bacterium]
MKEKILKLMLYIISLPFFLHAQDIPGSKDHPIISRYPGSKIYHYQVKEFERFYLLAGPVKSPSDKDIEMAKKEKLEGKVTIIQYLCPKERSAYEVFKNYEEAIRKSDFEIIYKGEGKEIEGIRKFLSEYNKLFYNIYATRDDPSGFFHLSLKKDGTSLSITVLDSWDGPKVFLGIIESKEMEKGLIKAEDIKNKLKKEGHIAIYGIYFDFDKADIKPESEPVLKEIARFLRENPEIKVYIVGHTDNVGKLDYNMELSRKRAENVVKELVNKYGISKERLKAFGVGPLAPISSNDTEEGRAKNRRVEIVKE